MFKISTWIELRSNILVHIDDHVLAFLSDYRQINSDTPEAGGVLLGFRRGIHLHITFATRPGRMDIRRNTHFERKDKSHQKIAAKLWKESGQYIDYLGEWHTHRQLQPTPSTLDYSEWRKIGDRRKSPSMIVTIIGLEGVWMGIVREKNITALVPAS